MNSLLNSQEQNHTRSLSYNYSSLQAPFQNAQSAKIIFKLQLNPESKEFKKFSLPVEQLSYDAVYHKAEFLLSQSAEYGQVMIRGKFSLMYEDMEGELITIKSSQELMDAIEEQKVAFNRQQIILKVKMPQSSDQRRKYSEQKVLIKQLGGLSTSSGTSLSKFNV